LKLSDAIPFQAAAQPFFVGQAHIKGHFRQNHEKYCDRNDTAPEALSERHANGIASENNVFSFRSDSRGSRKTVQCCLEKICGRAIERQTAINELPVCFQANRENLYESEERS
jgi:hypothetical protein